MSISSEITRINNNIAAAYTAANNKGATIPATQNSANLATCIGTISGGGGYSELPSYQVSNGVAVRRSGALTGNEFSGITSIGDYGLYYAFSECTNLTGNIDLSSLTSVGKYGLSSAFYNCTGLTSTLDLSLLTSIGDHGLSNAFRKCTNLTSVDLSSLISTVNSDALSYAFNACTGLTSVDLSLLTSLGKYGLSYAFSGCSNLTNINLSSLTSVDSYGLSYAFQNCTGLTSIDFPSLKTLTGSYSLQDCFRGCTSLTNVYFRALTTTSFGNVNELSEIMKSTGTTVTHTLHFPSNLQSTISGLTGYPLFGGTSGYVVCAFDLPATS